MDNKTGKKKERKERKRREREGEREKGKEKERKGRGKRQGNRGKLVYKEIQFKINRQYSQIHRQIRQID